MTNLETMRGGIVMDQPEYCLAEEAALLGGPELLECDKASGWLHKKLRTLDDLRPIDLIRTNAGDRLVEDALMRIAWGAPAHRGEPERRLG